MILISCFKTIHFHALSNLSLQLLRELLLPLENLRLTTLLWGHLENWDEL